MQFLNCFILIVSLFLELKWTPVLINEKREFIEQFMLPISLDTAQLWTTQTGLIDNDAQLKNILFILFFHSTAVQIL